MSRLNGSIAAMSSIVAGIAIAALWFYKTPDFEPLLAILAGLTGLVAAITFKKANLSTKIDLLLATLISFISIIGVIYLLSFTYKNHSPVIHSLTANRTIVAPGESVTIVVDATDKDNDPLSYIWSTNTGDVPDGNRGSKITYTAPLDGGAGIDIVRVTITDGKGGTAIKEITIAIQN